MLLVEEFTNSLDFRLIESSNISTNLKSSNTSLQSVSVTSTDDESIQLIQKKNASISKPNMRLPSLTNIAALFTKNCITMKRNLPLLFFVFFLPGIVLLINSITVGLSPADLPLALVNFESSCSDEYYMTRCEANQLGCYFKNALNRSDTVNLVPYSNKSLAIEDSKAGRVRGYLEVPSDFSTSFLKRILSSIEYEDFLYFYEVENEELIVKDKKVTFVLDASNPQLSLYIKKAISSSVDDFSKDVSRICKHDLGDSFDLSLVDIKDPILGQDEISFREFITPGMIALAIFFLAMALTSESFIAERSQGLLERSWITGVLPIEILISYILSQFFVMAVQVRIPCKCTDFYLSTFI